MFKWIGSLLAVGMLALAGCQMDHKMSGEASMDVCPGCPGHQHMTADGKCSGCKAQIADACPHCKGVQHVTADGKCSGCGMAVADACPKCDGVQPASMIVNGKCPFCAAKGAHGGT